MGIDINTTKLVQSGTDFAIQNSGSTTLLAYDTAGRLKKYANQPMFWATNSTANWVTLTANSWNLIPFNNPIINQNSCLASNRFTAPITGAYLINVSYYFYATVSEYCHTAFAVNGSLGGRNYGNNVHYRIAGHGTTAGYSFDSDTSEIYYLYAGDYVEGYVYATANPVNYFGVYSHFAGWFLG